MDGDNGVDPLRYIMPPYDFEYIAELWVCVGHKAGEIITLGYNDSKAGHHLLVWVECVPFAYISLYSGRE